MPREICRSLSDITLFSFEIASSPTKLSIAENESWMLRFSKETRGSSYDLPLLLEARNCRSRALRVDGSMLAAEWFTPNR